MRICAAGLERHRCNERVNLHKGQLWARNHSPQELPPDSAASQSRMAFGLLDTLIDSVFTSQPLSTECSRCPA
eukprot:4219894-Amphidinium_carterae.1